MNATNISHNYTNSSPGNTSRVLSQSGFSGGVRTFGSNYASNLIIGNNLSAAPPAGRFMLPGAPRATFASEASKSRAAMESGINSIKQQNVSNPASTIATVGKTASGVASGAMMASGIGTPVALAMQVSQAVGDAVHSGLNTSAQNASGRDLIANQQQWAIGGGKAAEAHYGMQQQAIAGANTGASIGSIFGPVGALAGWYLGMQHSNSSMDNAYKVGSFAGMQSATDSGVARSQNADAISGQDTMQNSL